MLKELTVQIYQTPRHLLLQLKAKATTGMVSKTKSVKVHQRDFYKCFTSLEIKEEIESQAIDKMVRNPAVQPNRWKGKKGQRKQGGEPGDS